jgi:hypothetical protein
MVTLYIKLSRIGTILLLLTLTTAMKGAVLLESVNSAGETVRKLTNTTAHLKSRVFIATIISHLAASRRLLVSLNQKGIKG